VSIPLIAVVGPVEPPLLAAFLGHYRTLGVARSLLAFHFPDQTPEADRARLLEVSRGLGVTPALVRVGPWHETTNTQLRDTLREQAGDGWHLLADVDEFPTFPAGLADTLAASTTGTVGGLLLDRIAADGRLRPWTPGEGLDAAYPLGGFLTHRLLHGDPRKIVAARAGIPVDHGNHRAPGHRSWCTTSSGATAYATTSSSASSSSPPAGGPPAARPCSRRPAA
jgi:hypothetical protein